MISKKDIPFNLLKAIEPIAQANLDLIEFKSEENTYYSFVETDPKSKNYFKILIDGTKLISNFDKSKYAVEMKPIDETGTRRHIFQDNIETVAQHFEKWINLVRDITNTPSVHDDNFTKTYSDFYFSEYKIFDNDAQTSPFNPIQQEKIELYIDSLIEEIETTTESIAADAKSELISDLKEVKNTLSASTKNKVMRGITNVFGKLYKLSKNLASEIAKGAKKKLIDKLIELGIEYAPKLLEAFNKHHSGQ